MNTEYWLNIYTDESGNFDSSEFHATEDEAAEFCQGSDSYSHTIHMNGNTGTRFEFNNDAPLTSEDLANAKASYQLGMEREERARA